MEKSKQKRTTIRSLTTKLLTKIENIYQDDKVTIDELDELMSELMLKQEQLKEIDLEIQTGITDVNEIDTEIITCDEYLTNIVRSKSRLKRKIEKLSTSVISPELNSNISEPKINTNIRINETSSVKLPLLTIEKFSGDPADWQRFYDQFESAIDKNTGLSNVEKFNYLKTYLVGSASDAIKGFSLTNNNYVSAIETLKERFGKKTLIINSHLNKLLSLTPVEKSTDIFSLRKLFDSCQTEIRNLDSLGINQENYGALLCPILIKLLPSDIVLEITKKYSNDDEWKVSEILDILKTEVISREKATALSSSITRVSECSPFPSSKRSSGGENSHKQNKNRISTASGLLNESSNKKNKCISCGNDRHNLWDCNEFKMKEMNEKRDILKRSGCCFICFRFGHTAKKCRSFVKCDICFRRHYTFMCPEKKTDSKVESTVLSNETCNPEVLMQTLTIRLINGKKEIVIRGLIDTGSQKSYLLKETINKIGYKPIGQENLNHSLFGGLQRTNQHNKYRIFLSDLNRDYFCNFEVYDQEKICTEIPKIRDGSWIKEANKLGIKFCDYKNMEGSNSETKEIDLLIGADVCGKLFTGIIKSVSENLIAFETRLGWTLMGKTRDPENSNSTNTVLSLHVAQAKISDLWKLDTLGILDPGEKESREEIAKATEDHFNRNIKVLEDGRYEVSLPWILNHPTLPNYRSVAERRLKNCVESLKKSEILEDYEAVFKEWLQEGIIEEVDPDDTATNEHFLPHRAVIKENSTTKIRPVFDGSTKIKNFPSINNCLEKGPNLVELIPSVINRFRLNKIGVIADIRKAFLQIQLSEADRPFLRFLWCENGDLSKIKIYQHRRVVFGLTCSPYLLGATLRYHLKKAPESMLDTAVKLEESFYVDNCLTSVEDREHLHKFMTESQYILKRAQFDLRGWEHSILNSQEVAIPKEERKVPVLGLIWKLSTDSLTLDLKETSQASETLTKRKILSEVHKVFDPIGYTCPVTLRPKIMLQECWKLKCTWDAELPSSIRKTFEKWQKQLSQLKDITIPRCLLDNPEGSRNLSLHIFCDASKVAYATCIFLRSQNEDSTSCQLIQARSRVAPLKPVTIPRLELLSCTIGARLAHGVISDLRLENIQTFCRSDSVNALFWIKRIENWAPFAYNRVREIRSLSLPEEWNYVPGSLNPADLPSRGCSAEHLK
ncbi:uncharacterized protein [Parasteatoda tepidariorum]|uniref:uncharacterized protein n=1 Tax=Parasteatoda tepidariorum TaxID=114398 RepID=UPI001C728E18|nr:uncharacterized protein LOC122269769 [Parasteatoda tepidariorum]